MTLSGPLRDAAIAWAALDRRLSTWRARAHQLALERELGDRARWGRQLRLESGVIWRLGAPGRLELGDEVTIRTGSELKVDGLLRVGRRVLIGPWCTLSVLDEVAIGDDCLLAERVSIRDHDHRYEDLDRPIHEQGYSVARVRLGRDVWLGAGVTIMKGVELGDHCVVGANAVVTRSFPAGCVLAGVPARVIRRLEPMQAHHGHAP